MKILNEIINKEINSDCFGNLNGKIMMWFFGTNGSIAYNLYKQLSANKLHDFFIIWAKCEMHDAKKIYEDNKEVFPLCDAWGHLEDPDYFNEYYNKRAMEETVKLFLLDNSNNEEYSGLANELRLKAEKIISRYKNLNDDIASILQKANLLEIRLPNEHWLRGVFGMEVSGFKTYKKNVSLATWFYSVKRSKGVFEDTLKYLFSICLFDKKNIDGEISKKYLENYYKYVVSKNASYFMNIVIHRHTPFKLDDYGIGEIKEARLFFEDSVEQLLVILNDGKKVKLNVRFEWIFKNFFKYF